MKPDFRQLLALLLGAGVCMQLAAQTPAFTYQGRLTENGEPASGFYDLALALYDSVADGTGVGVPLTNNAVAVTNGLFTVALDFGPDVFDGAERWLEIGVATNGGGPFTALVPRQQITSTPYAIQAATAKSVDAGTISDPVFIGTTTTTPLELFVNNQRALRLEDNGDGSDGDLTSDGAPNVIGGSPANLVGAGVVGATIAGGGAALSFDAPRPNVVLADYGTIGGGANNEIRMDSTWSTVGGGNGNAIGQNATLSTVSGGGGNTIAELAQAATIGGGFGIAVGANAGYSTISGGYDNEVGVAAQATTISGGGYNAIGMDSSYGTIGGGGQNTVGADSAGTTIAGGFGNTVDVNGNYASIGGGFTNRISLNATYAVIGGGEANAIQPSASHATISGGSNSDIGPDSRHSAIGGGLGNNIASNSIYTTIAGGNANHIGTMSGHSTVGGGIRNRIDDEILSATIAGGSDNNVGNQAWNAAIGGGFLNTIGTWARGSSIGGGRENAVADNSSYGTIAGGKSNTIGPADDGGTVSGGQHNIVASNSPFATISGGGTNFIGLNSRYSTIGGGQNNEVTLDAWFATIAGGREHIMGEGATDATIGGGHGNQVLASLQSTVAGGVGNTIVGSKAAAIGGGQDNTVAQSSSCATIAGGFQNEIGINAGNSFIGGGGANTIAGSARYAVIPGGYMNTVGASATSALAAGRQAQANHPGAFVWADSTDAPFASTGNNQFLIRASGGVGIGTTTPAAPLTIGTATSSYGWEHTDGAARLSSFVSSGGGYLGTRSAHPLNLFVADGLPSLTVSGAGNVGIGTTTPASRLTVRTADFDYGWEHTDGAIRLSSYINPLGGWIGTRSTDSLHFFVADGGASMTVNENGNVGIGTTVPATRLHVSGTITCTSLTQTSDRNAKENFRPVDPVEALAKVATLPISRWNFKGDARTPHLGPMAQDFHAAFGLGTSDKHIATVDADGVALAAIQGLNQKLEAQNAALRAELSELRTQVRQLLDHQEPTVFNAPH